MPNTLVWFCIHVRTLITSNQRERKLSKNLNCQIQGFGNGRSHQQYCVFSWDSSSASPLFIKETFLGLHSTSCWRHIWLWWVNASLSALSQLNLNKPMRGSPFCLQMAPEKSTCTDIHSLLLCLVTHSFVDEKPRPQGSEQLPARALMGKITSSRAQRKHCCPISKMAVKMVNSAGDWTS